MNRDHYMSTNVHIRFNPKNRYRPKVLNGNRAFQVISGFDLLWHDPESFWLRTT